MSKSARTASKRSRRRSGRGTLMMISMLLIGSAIVRLGSDASRAFAREQAPDHAMTEALGQPAACETPDSLRDMLAVFRKREEQLKLRETQLLDRMQALSVADREVDRKLAMLTSAEEDLRATLALADTAAEDDIGKLIAVYENMKPKNAAALFEKMDPEFAAGFLARMRSDAAAGIMAGLTPQAAYTISVVLAGRNAAVPKD